MDVKIGIEDADRKEIADGLARLLADSYSLYLKSHNYHWNVTGPMFRSLHLMFEEHYLELADAVDVVAERIRALGFPAPATFSEYRTLSAIEAKEGVPEAMEMVRDLVVGRADPLVLGRCSVPFCVSFTATTVRASSFFTRMGNTASA